VRLDQIRHFITVIEAGSIRAAARTLELSQPAITKSIRSLEGELGAALIRRTTTGVILTPSGRAFLARARAIQAEARHAQEELAQIAGQPGGAVAFGVAPVVGATVVPGALVQFLRQYPAASVRIVEGQTHMLLSLVRDETLDFSVGMKPDDELPKVVAFRPLFRTQFVVAARQGHPLANATSLRELARASWIDFSPRIEQAFITAGVPAPARPVRCESFMALLSTLAKTDALGFVTTHVLAQPIARGALQRIPVREALPTVTVGMVTRTYSPLTPAATAMTKAVIEVARRLAKEEGAD
jgi:LysR family transcriptional regulator, regulator of abg operon